MRLGTILIVCTAACVSELPKELTEPTTPSDAGEVQTRDALQDAAPQADAGSAQDAGDDAGSLLRPDAMPLTDAAPTLDAAPTPDAGPPAPVGNCDQPTPWNQIAGSLAAAPTLLPELPERALDLAFADPVPELMFHELRAQGGDAIVPGAANSCELSSAWDAQRIQAGGFVPADGDLRAAHCRVREKSVQNGQHDLLFYNRFPAGNIRVPITGEPNWVRMRFPIPNGHHAVKFSYSVNWARLFGSHPQRCAPADTDDDGNCLRNALAEGEDWSENVEAGLFLLWGRAGDCQGWLITGPHEPIASPSWSAAQNYSVAVPDSLKNVGELVVSLLTYHQYPGGCSDAFCGNAPATYSHLGFVSAKLQTESNFSPPREPPQSHPRLFGDDAQWMAEHALFDALPCRASPNWPSHSGWGEIPNIRNLWDIFTKGGSPCLETMPESITDIADAAAYLNGEAAQSFNVTRSVGLLHMIRFERACRRLQRDDCQFSEAELNRLIAALIDIEMARIRNAPWNTHGFDFDLRTREPMRVYTLLADVLWDRLTAEQHAEILSVTGEQVDAFLVHFHVPHWAIYNGNNWTPVLAEAAMYWAITYYHEDQRAPEVAWRALQSLWLHRHSYLSDGVYEEGLMMYSQVSFDPLMIVDRLAKSAFGVELSSIPWEHFPDFADWAMAFIAPDGQTIDFADAWPKRGWGTFMPLLAHMTSPRQRGLNAEPDPCFAHQFFSNKYYHHGMADPWGVHPALARDWHTIASSCADDQGMIPNGVEIRAWEQGGWGGIRIGLPGSTTFSDGLQGVAPSRFRQADQVMLAVSAIPNTSPHTELDFGTLIWTAFGNRLIWDFSYGTLDRRRYLTEPDHPVDQNPTGHSTLVIPEALHNGNASTNTSQIDGETGTIRVERLGDHQFFVLDGSSVYGRDDPALGWLQSFHRRILPLASGTIIVIDDFAVRQDRGSAAVAEYWYTQSEGDGEPQPNCIRQDTRLARTVTPTTLRLVPRCAALDNQPAQSAGLIVGTARSPGGFVDEGEISLINRLNNATVRARIAWRPEAPVTDDLRVFAMIAATHADNLPQASWNWVACAAARCARLDIDGSPTLTLGFSPANQLVSVLEH